MEFILLPWPLTHFRSSSRLGDNSHRCLSSEDSSSHASLYLQKVSTSLEFLSPNSVSYSQPTMPPISRFSPEPSWHLSRGILRLSLISTFPGKVSFPCFKSYSRPCSLQGNVCGLRVRRKPPLSASPIVPLLGLFVLLSTQAYIKLVLILLQPPSTGLWVWHRAKPFCWQSHEPHSFF